MENSDDIDKRINEDNKWLMPRKGNIWVTFIIAMSVIAIAMYSMFSSNKVGNSNKGNIGIKDSTVKQSNDKVQIQNLIIQVLNWSDSKDAINLLPALEGKDRICVGFDLEKLKLNLEKLKETNLFSEEFIGNYNQIILTLDKKIKNKEFDSWNTGELPTFSFDNDINPWTLCQDVPYEKPNPLDLVEVKIISLDSAKGELYWKWGRPELNGDSSWYKFTYSFRVAKENGKWKIAYMEGFDFKQSIRKDGL